MSISGFERWKQLGLQWRVVHINKPKNMKSFEMLCMKEWPRCLHPCWEFQEETQCCGFLHKKTSQNTVCNSDSHSENNVLQKWFKDSFYVERTLRIRPSTATSCQLELYNLNDRFEALCAFSLTSCLPLLKKSPETMQNPHRDNTLIITNCSLFSFR